MPLNIGDPAPPFAGINQHGERIALADFAGQTVVLYVYPRDDTPGCTKEACSLRDGFCELRKRGIVVIGVSGDSVASHQRFASKYDLPFHLLADPDWEVIEAYGASRGRLLGILGIRRHSYLIGPDGIIQHIFRKVDTRNHARQILHVLPDHSGLSATSQ
jgi:peroxiredoxin Q/BCP